MKGLGIKYSLGRYTAVYYSENNEWRKQARKL